jgi:hypothetical protein
VSTSRIILSSKISFKYMGSSPMILSAMKYLQTSTRLLAVLQASSGGACSLRMAPKGWDCRGQEWRQGQHAVGAFCSREGVDVRQ